MNPTALGYVDALRSRLARLRQKLLASINRRLASSNMGTDNLVDAMCAYSLATSSSCADILRHFHHVRLDALATVLKRSEVQISDALYSLELWTRTMRDTQSIFPRQLAGALTTLKARPILRDAATRSIPEFDLDVHEDWIGDDIRNFIPYVRHDDLTVASAAQMLSSWAPLALKAMLDGITNFLATVDDPEVVIALRHDSLQSWFTNHTYAMGIAKGEVLDALRNVFRKRLLELVKSRCQAIHDVKSFIEETLSHWDSDANEKTNTPLWSEEIACMDISHGVEPFTKALTVSVYGRMDRLLATHSRYQRWVEHIEGLRQAISSLRTVRWDDDDLDSDDDDEGSWNMRQKVLSEEDPEILSTHLNKSLDQGLFSLQDSIADITKRVEGSTDSGSKAAYLIRVVREMKQQLPTGVQSTELDFPYTITLCRTIASPISETVLQGHWPAISKAVSRSELPGRALWEGSPELPTLPSPWTFKVLRTTELELGKAGFDLWTCKAIDEFKILLRTGLADLVSKAIPRPSTNDESAEDASPDRADDSKENIKPSPDKPPPALGTARPWSLEHEPTIQTLFDLEYLDAATSSTHDTTQKGDRFIECRDALKERLALSQALDERMQNGAVRYWKRTKLLFALLG